MKQNGTTRMNLMKKAGMIFILSVLMSGLLPMSVFADEGSGSTGTSQDAVDVYSLPAGTEFTLTYPDGSVVTTSDPAEADALMKEYKLMYEAETNKNGEITIKDLINVGELKIEELEAPEGYIKDPVIHEVGVHEGKIEIVNRKRPKTDVSVEKIWKDDNDRDGIRPESVTVNLYADGEKVDSASVDPDPNGDWKYTFKNLEAETPEGKKITYTISENRVKRYTTDIKGDAENGFIITNTHTPETTEIFVNKIWEDYDNADGIRPDKVTVTLYADGKIAQTADIKADENGFWEGSFKNLPMYRDEGRRIRYIVRETVIPKGYNLKSTMNDGEFVTIVNAHDVPKEELEKTKVSIEKVWDDKDDLDGVRPDYITVKLFADGDEVNSRIIEPDINNNWKTTFNDLPKINSRGENIEYTVTEVRVREYSAAITGDAANGFTITNTHTPGTTQYTVKKIWDDAGDKDRIRPESVSIELLADDTVVRTAEIRADENGDWTADFDGLPRFREDGTQISYTARETTIPDGYELMSITSQDNVITLTNKHDVPKEDTPPEKRINGRRGTVKLANRDKDITYTINTEVPENAETVTFTDTLEDVLVLKEAYLEAENTSLDDFVVQTEGQKLTAALTGEDLAEVRGQRVTLTIICNIDPQITDEELISKYGAEKKIPNKAIVNIDGKPKATNTVRVIPPGDETPTPTPTETPTPTPSKTPTPSVTPGGGGGPGAPGNTTKTSTGNAAPARTGDPNQARPWIITGISAAACMILLLAWRRKVNRGKKE